MATLQEQKAVLESSLADAATYSNKSRFLETETAYKKIIDELSRLTLEYEKLFDKLMELERKSSS